MTETTELVGKADVVEKLYRFGLDEQEIANALGLDPHLVRGVLVTRQVTTRFINPADKELADAMRHLAWVAYKEALSTIRYGSSGERLGLIKTILGRTTSMVGMETTTRLDDMRNEFDEMVSGIVTNPIAPDLLDIEPDAELSATPFDSYYSDQGVDD